MTPQGTRADLEESLGEKYDFGASGSKLPNANRSASGEGGTTGVYFIERGSFLEGGKDVGDLADLHLR